MSVQKEFTVDKIMKTFQSSTVPVTIETLRLLPDSLVFGTAILSLLSMCKSYGVLLFTMVELMITQRAFSMIIGGIAPIGAGKNSLQDVCQPGFYFSNSMRISLLETIGTPSMFPSPSMFFLSGFISYMIGSMQQFGREIKSLSGDIAVRTTIAAGLSFLFIIAMLIFRYSYGCESFGSIILSAVLGSVMGMVFVFQNIAIFGRDGINILNLPMIQTALERGKPMYVCGPSDI
jgi:hypothetical protein